jgi:mono/diheme cytochrome c family protein
MKRLMGLALAGLFTVAVVHAADIDGKKVFGAKCSMCHGLDGKGKAAMAKVKKLDPSALDMTKASTTSKPLEDLVKATSEGNGKMGAMKGKMTPAEIEASVKYMLTLSAAKDDAKKEDVKKAATKSENKKK